MAGRLLSNHVLTAVRLVTVSRRVSRVLLELMNEIVKPESNLVSLASLHNGVWLIVF